MWGVELSLTSFVADFYSWLDLLNKSCIKA